MAKSKKNTPRKFNFSLSLAGLLSSVVFVGLALIWSFILGVIVGRGYHPQSLVLDSQKKSTAEKKQEKKQKIRESEVLKPEELEFYEVLSHPEEKAARDSGAICRFSSKGEEKDSRVSSEKPEERLEKKQNVLRYLYTYQVAAFRDKKKALSLKKRINRTGLNCRLKKVHKNNKIWHRIFVTFKGRPQETRLIKEKLAHLGIENPFLKDKESLGP